MLSQLHGATAAPLKRGHSARFSHSMPFFHRIAALVARLRGAQIKQDVPQVVSEFRFGLLRRLLSKVSRA